MADAPRYRPERAVRGAPWSLLLVLGLVSSALLARAYWPAPTTVPTLVTVEGQVPRPGTYALERATVFAAIRAAGGTPEGDQDAFVPAGHKVIVTDGRGLIAPPGDPLLVAIPVDPNTADVEQLDGLPGVGPALARKIVEHREKHGPFANLQVLRRTIGPKAFDQLAPFVQLSPVALVDLNRASAVELERLPGIGPVLAARIVVDREEHGPYTALEELGRVSGVGDAVLEPLRPLVVVR